MQNMLNLMQMVVVMYKVTHGQLSVVMSHVKSSDAITVYVKDIRVAVQ